MADETTSADLAEKAADTLLAADLEWARTTAGPWSVLPDDRVRVLAGAVMAAVADAVKARATELERDAVHALDIARAEGWAAAARFIMAPETAPGGKS